MAKRTGAPVPPSRFRETAGEERARARARKEAEKAKAAERKPIRDWTNEDAIKTMESVLRDTGRPPNEVRTVMRALARAETGNRSFMQTVKELVFGAKQAAPSSRYIKLRKHAFDALVNAGYSKKTADAILDRLSGLKIREKATPEPPYEGPRALIEGPETLAARAANETVQPQPPAPAAEPPRIITPEPEVKRRQEEDRVPLLDFTEITPKAPRKTGPAPLPAGTTPIPMPGTVEEPKPKTFGEVFEEEKKKLEGTKKSDEELKQEIEAGWQKLTGQEPEPPLPEESEADLQSQLEEEQPAAQPPAMLAFRLGYLKLE